MLLRSNLAVRLKQVVDQPSIIFVGLDVDAQFQFAIHDDIHVFHETLVVHVARTDSHVADVD